MAAALAMIGGFAVTPAVVVIKHEMLTLVPDDIRDSFKVPFMIGDDKSGRAEGDDHSSSKNIAALIVI